MPNTGKPSKDCHLCRSRRVKCDLTKPACQRCFKYGAPCPGYRPEQELIFRNAGPTSIEKRKKRSRKGVSQWSEAALPSRLSLSTTTTDYSAPSKFPGDGFVNTFAQSAPLNLVSSDPVPSDLSPSDKALILPKSLNEHWTAHSVPILLSIYSTLDFLRDIYKGYPGDGPLIWAAHLFSRTYITNLQYSTAVYKDSVAENNWRLGIYLGKTLSSVNVALKNPGGAMRDEVLATVWILTNYEVFMGSTNRMELVSPWHLHAHGLYSILKARGSEWLRSPAAHAAFWPSYNIVQVQCLLTNTECPPESVDWLRVIKETMHPDEAIGYYVSIFITKVAHIQARILSLLLSRDFNAASAEYYDLIGAMSKAEDGMEALFERYPGTGDFNLYMRNIYYATCVKGYHILTSYTNFITHHIVSPIPLGVLKLLRLQCIQVCRRYAQEILDRQPQCLSQKQNHQSPKVLFEALKLIWPLTSVYVMPSTLPDQKELAEKSLRFIGRELMVRQALKTYTEASIFPPEAIKPLDVIRDESCDGLTQEA